MIQDSSPVTEVETQPITQWLHAARDGNDGAMESLFEAVYPLLYRMASAKPGVHRNSALSPTSLVNELYLKIADSSVLDASDRQHFYTTCSRAMRFIVADFARAALAAKRGGDVNHCALTQALAAQPDRSQELIDIHAALDDLQEVQPRLRELVELKFFGGLTHVEIASLQGRSDRSVKRDWQTARAFLLARTGHADV